MTQKIKKEVYVDPKQDEGLKKLAEVMGVSEDELIERAIGSYVSRERSKKIGKVAASPAVFGWRNRDEMYEETLAERGKPLPGLRHDIDESEIERRWQKELRKMRDRRFVRLLGDTESDWDRNSIYDERIDDLPG